MFSATLYKFERVKIPHIMCFTSDQKFAIIDMYAYISSL